MNKRILNATYTNINNEKNEKYDYISAYRYCTIRIYIEKNDDSHKNKIKSILDMWIVISDSMVFGFHNMIFCWFYYCFFFFWYYLDIYDRRWPRWRIIDIQLIFWNTVFLLYYFVIMNDNCYIWHQYFKIIKHFWNHKI